MLTAVSNHYDDEELMGRCIKTIDFIAMASVECVATTATDPVAALAQTGPHQPRLPQTGHSGDQINPTHPLLRLGLRSLAIFPGTRASSTSTGAT